VEVNGVAGQVSFGPAPIGVFDDQTGIAGQNKIACLAWGELESPLLQEWRQWCEPGGADLLARPAGATPGWIKGVGGLSLFSSGVG
jgi:hypothetical protein